MSRAMDGRKLLLGREYVVSSSAGRSPGAVAQLHTLRGTACVRATRRDDGLYIQSLTVSIGQ